ncbi:MAG: hypothetical protein JHC87_05155 [Thermoleophilaceae bacterium]|nr:hypothetical protein [Thermoleophilaceae bacterium]
MLLQAQFAVAHDERPSTWPTYAATVPEFRTTGPSLVVCQPDSFTRIIALPDAGMRAANLALLDDCAYSEIQSAVNDAVNGTRIQVLPGVYTEPTARSAPYDDPTCAGMTATAGSGAQVPNYEYNRTCPNARNLIAVIGDSDGDRKCDDKCNIQIAGTARRQDVTIDGDRTKQNVFRADRADGFYLGNMTIQYSDFNNVYVLETAGFQVDSLITRWSREYGVLSFTSEAGLYDNIEAYGSGDSGVYPGSGSQGLQSERSCLTFGTEIRNVDSYANNLGYSGTAGDSVWVHDSKFHDNATGMTTDSFAAGHPGMPQHCAKWEHNEIYSNNFEISSPDRLEYCRKPYSERDPKFACSAFPSPAGVGALIAGGNGNIVRDNRIYNNNRAGVMLMWVPALARGDSDLLKQFDTSYDNRFTNNTVGVAPNGDRKPNGDDFWWDGEGAGNCWSGNDTARVKVLFFWVNVPVSSTPSVLPPCGTPSVFSPGNLVSIASNATCAAWTLPDAPPPGCSWAKARKPLVQ